MPSSARIFPRLLLALLCGAAGRSSRADDVKFSATLTAAQRERAGLPQLSADNLAVIDGLIRQDEAASKFKNNDVDHTRFTERHTPRERDLAGLGRLTPDQKAQLDEYVSERISGPTPSIGAPLRVVSATAVNPSPTDAKLDIHGQISFTYGWGKGGNVYGGDVVLTYEDPAGRYAVMVGYSEYHGRGLVPACLAGYGPYRAYPGMVPPFP